MDTIAIILLVFLCLIVFSHPSTKQLFRFEINKRRNSEECKCLHTIGDCRDCMLSSECPMKNEYVVVVPKEDEYS